MNLSPLQLELVIFERERLEIFPENCNDKFRVVNNKVDFHVEFGKASTDHKEYDAIKFQLQVNKNKRKVPIKVDIKGLALFSIEGQIESSKKERLLVFNGSSIVFGFLRGYIFAKVSNLPPHCSLIPTVNLLEILKEKLEVENNRN